MINLTVAKIKELQAQGLGDTRIARELGVGATTVATFRKKNGIGPTGRVGSKKWDIGAKFGDFFTVTAREGSRLELQCAQGHAISLYDSGLTNAKKYLLVGCRMCDGGRPFSHDVIIHPSEKIVTKAKKKRPAKPFSGKLADPSLSQAPKSSITFSPAKKQYQEKRLSPSYSRQIAKSFQLNSKG